MCTRFYVEAYQYSNIITRAQKLRLANDMMVQLAKPLQMTGEMRPTDMAAVLAPNKDGKPAAFPMIWGFSHKQLQCRLSTVVWKMQIKRSFGRIRGTDGDV